MAGAVQHAHLLCRRCLWKIVEAEACEVHLATNFQNMLFDRLSADLKGNVAWLDQKNAADRKPDMTDEQFYYKTRKNVIGPFSQDLANVA